jgi:hypothetical protein
VAFWSPSGGLQISVGRRFYAHIKRTFTGSEFDFMSLQWIFKRQGTTPVFRHSVDINENNPKNKNPNLEK